MPDEFCGDETLLTFHKILVFSLIIMSAKMMIFNSIKLSMKPIEIGLICLLVFDISADQNRRLADETR